MRAHLDIVVHATMLEEELLVTPVGANRVRTADQPSDESLFATEFGRLVEGEYLEHRGVHWDDRNLILKVVLVLVSPPIDIVRLNIELIWPVRILLLVAVLVELGDVHHGCSTNVISDSSQMLANGLSSAHVVGFSEDGRPAVFKEVKGLVAVEREHGEPVGRVHTISEQFDTVAWNSLGSFWRCCDCIRDSHDTVLGTLEAASVGSVGVSDELNLGHGTDGMGHLDSTWRHAVGNNVVRVVHILIEE